MIISEIYLKISNIQNNKIKTNICTAVASQAILQRFVRRSPIKKFCSDLYDGRQSRNYPVLAFFFIAQS